jgi:hypothetical protein
VALQVGEETKVRLKLIEHHWLHCRHIENERGWFMIYYVIAIAGGSIYSLSPENFISPWFPYFVILFTFFGFYQTLRWSYAFENHRNNVNSLIIEIGEKLPTMDIPPLRLWKAGIVFRTRYLFPLFYLIILMIFAFLFQGKIKCYAISALIIALFVGIGAILSFRDLDKKEFHYDH